MNSYLTRFTNATRKLVPYFAVGTAGGIFLIGHAPNTWLLDKYKFLLQLENMDRPVKLGKKLSNLTQEVLDKLKSSSNWDDSSVSKLDVFISGGFNDPLYKGNTKNKNGAIIGVPVFFKFEDPDDVPLDQYVINDILITEGTEEADALADSLVLSENAKKFAIARTMHMANTHYLYVRGILQSSFFLLTCLAANQMNRRVTLAPSVRFPMYCVLGGLSFLIYLSIWDQYNCARDRSADEKTAKLGKDFAEGGIQYYTKVLKRNRAIYVIMGDLGYKAYTSSGEAASSLLRFPHVRFCDRREKIHKIYNEFESSLGESK